MNHSATQLLCAGLFVASVALGEETPRACKAVEQLVQVGGCRLTECRLGGLSTVLLGSEEGPRFETRGDLLLLDHECDSKSTIPVLFAEQQRALQTSSFVQEGSSTVQKNFGAMVYRKDGMWLELTALLLEGAPTLSVRAVRTDGKDRPRVIEPQGSGNAGGAVVETVTAPATEMRAQVTTPIPPSGGDSSVAAKPEGGSPKIVSRSDAALPAGFAPSQQPVRVTVEVMIDEKGTIARVLSTRGNPALLSPALQAIRNWTFEPAMLAGKASAGVLELDVNFKSRQ